MKVYLNTLGCRLNESEVEQMGRMFHFLGHEIVKDASEAELCVLNTCAVTNDAGKKSRQMVRKAAKHSPDAKIIVTGCYSEIEREKVLALPGVVEIISNTDKDRLVQKVLDLGDQEIFDLEPLAREMKPGEMGRTRAFIKVQDGCDNRCTFCVTTIARGAGRSRSLSDILREINALHETGYQEAVLSGVHLGSYGRDLKEGVDLGILLSTILKETSIPRIRISSLEPWDIPPRFFELWSNPRLCRYLHMPLQAGCDATLKRMARRTRKAAFRSLVEEARLWIPDVAISSDMIVGFPGETDAEFEETKAFVEDMDFCHIHVFRYSIRPGTAAATMPNQVDSAAKSARSTQLLEIAKHGRVKFYQKAVGKETNVLWEKPIITEDKKILWQGLTDNYIRVRTTAPRSLHNKLLRAELVSFDEIECVLGAKLL